MTYKSSTICSKEEGLDQDGEKWSEENQILNDTKGCHQARPHTSVKTGSAIIFLWKNNSKASLKIWNSICVPLAKKKHMHLKFNTATSETATLMHNWTQRYYAHSKTSLISPLHYQGSSNIYPLSCQLLHLTIATSSKQNSDNLHYTWNFLKHSMRALLDVFRCNLIGTHWEQRENKKHQHSLERPAPSNCDWLTSMALMFQPNFLWRKTSSIHTQFGDFLPAYVPASG